MSITLRKHVSLDRYAMWEKAPWQKSVQTHSRQINQRLQCSHHYCLCFQLKFFSVHKNKNEQLCTGQWIFASLIHGVHVTSPQKQNIQLLTPWISFVRFLTLYQRTHIESTFLCLVPQPCLCDLFTTVYDCSSLILIAGSISLYEYSTVYLNFVLLWAFEH